MITRKALGADLPARPLAVSLALLAALLALALAVPAAPALAGEPQGEAQSEASAVLEITSAMQNFINDARWSNGVAWGYYQRPKLSSWDSIGCCAYASDFAKYVYGVSGPSTGTAFSSPSEIRAGDIIHGWYSITKSDGTTESGEHWLCILERNADGSFLTAEGNALSKVRVVTDAAAPVYRADGGKFQQYTYNRWQSWTSIEGWHFQGANQAPTGTAEVIEGGDGCVHVVGWAIDPDNLSTSIPVHVYIGDEGHEIGSGLYRADVNNAYGASGNHGFDAWIATSKTGSQTVTIYAIDPSGAGPNTAIYQKTVTVNARVDHSVSNIRVTDVSESGYTVLCDVANSVYGK